MATFTTGFGLWFEWTLFVQGFGTWVNFLKGEGGYSSAVGYALRRYS